MPRSTGLREHKRRMTREAIVRAATELFTGQGFARTTVADIAGRAGVAPRTFFLHFASKEDVLFHHVERYVEIALARVAALPDGTTPWEAVQRAVESLVDALNVAGTNIDALAPVRVQVARESGGMPPSLAVRLHGVQTRILDAIRARHPGLDPVRCAAHLGACVGAVSAVASQGEEPPSARTDAMRHAIVLASAGFTAHSGAPTL
ncbi:TetR/AcrR family transcriptional regulator [Nonomuraea sp. NPDC050790]|uniref:TetR/AcrR family transcriptional regulator n=1 Tax=Nonomuraea sp. NPDC050790 TaxID=3364371 RepID=UPI0037B8A5DE